MGIRSVGDLQMTFTHAAELASVLGLVVSVVGLLITLWVAREVAQVRRAYVRRVRIPELLERFSDLTSGISDSLNNFSVSRDASLKAISQLHSTAKSIATKLEKKERDAINSLITLLDKSELTSLDEASVRVVYLTAISAHEGLANLNRDLVWQ